MLCVCASHTYYKRLEDDVRMIDPLIVCVWLTHMNRIPLPLRARWQSPRTEGIRVCIQVWQILAPGGNQSQRRISYWSSPLREVILWYQPKDSNANGLSCSITPHQVYSSWKRCQSFQENTCQRSQIICSLDNVGTNENQWTTSFVQTLACKTTRET